MKNIKKFQNALYGVERIEVDKSTFDKFKNLSYRNIQPPSYVVKFLLIDILEFKDHGRLDKVMVVLT